MTLPALVIVGRPNVGKSTLFNRMVGRRQAIVRPEPGVTRDRHFGRGEWEGRTFLAVDTGGIAAPEDDPFSPLIARQTASAIEEADVVITMVDGAEGLLPQDAQIADMVRAAGKPVLLAVNKIDVKGAGDTLWDFARLGLGDPLPISAEHATGVAELLQAALARAPGEEDEPPQEGEIRVAVVGRPNVGKSSLINRLLGDERTLVSPLPGTTRDPIDSLLRRGEKVYRFIDTAGIRRRGKIGDRKVEAVSMILAYRSIERAEVVLLIVDATEGVRSMDAQIAHHIVDSGRACVVLLNKWDLVEKDSKTFDEAVRALREKLVHIDFAPVLSASALTGQRCERVFEAFETASASHRRRVPTRALNLALAEWTKAHPPPAGSKGRRPKILYATQASVAPPRIVLFASGMPHETYGRYIENQIREKFGFEGTPVRIAFRPKVGKPARGRGARAGRGGGRRGGGGRR